MNYITHHYFLQEALLVAMRSMNSGNLPFGCVLVSPDNTVLLDGENTVVTGDDPLGHCEMNLLHRLKNGYDAAYLQQCTLYATTEPCAMCAAAIYWSGIGKLVYAMDKQRYHAIAGSPLPEHMLAVRARDIFSCGGRKVHVVGPLMEKETGLVYAQWLHGNEYAARQCAEHIC
ncbi:MAG: nucleoside deaminase [Chitinophagaceae bacterium]